MTFQLKQNQAEVICNYQATQSVILADALHLNDVFINLLSNSLKYSVKKPLIHIETRNLNQKVEITVSDNGIGIPTQEFKRIFEKYYRISTGDVHTTKGFGIGLYYVKTVIKAHQGTITVQSENQKGSNFIILLPVINQS